MAIWNHLRKVKALSASLKKSFLQINNLLRHKKLHERSAATSIMESSETSSIRDIGEISGFRRAAEHRHKFMDMGISTRDEAPTQTSPYYIRPASYVPSIEEARLLFFFERAGA